MNKVYKRLLLDQLWDGDPTTEPNFNVEDAIDSYDELQEEKE